MIRPIENMQEAPLISLELSEAENYIHEQFEIGERPIITVPREFIESAKKGLREHSTWDPAVRCLAGTFGIEPYLPSDEERIAIVLRYIKINQVHPRATGPDKKFHGVVIIDGPISPNDFEILNPEEVLAERAA